VAVLIIDGVQGVTQVMPQCSYAEQSGRSVIIVVNKWDLAVEPRSARQMSPQKRAG